jgi:hypothetical protein
MKSILKFLGAAAGATILVGAYAYTQLKKIVITEQKPIFDITSNPGVIYVYKAVIHNGADFNIHIDYVLGEVTLLSGLKIEIVADQIDLIKGEDHTVLFRLTDAAIDPTDFLEAFSGKSILKVDLFIIKYDQVLYKTEFKY